MTRARIEIDLNSRDRDGITRARLQHASAPLQRGQIVTAFESEDQVHALAYVDRVDEEKGYAFLTVNWDSLTEDDGNEVQAPLHRESSVSNRAFAAAENARANRNIDRDEASIGAVSKLRIDFKNIGMPT